MGTHPIFESDFDCLTECQKNSWTKSLSTLSYCCPLPTILLEWAKPDALSEFSSANGQWEEPNLIFQTVSHFLSMKIIKIQIFGFLIMIILNPCSLCSKK